MIARLQRLFERLRVRLCLRRRRPERDELCVSVERARVAPETDARLAKLRADLAALDERSLAALLDRLSVIDPVGHASPAEMRIVVHGVRLPVLAVTAAWRPELAAARDVPPGNDSRIVYLRRDRGAQGPQR